MTRPISKSLPTACSFLVALCLPACESAAGLGDDAIRFASYGRVQATPFMDAQNKKTCQAALKQALGFPKEARAMKNGVMVVQSFQCEAERIVAKVSLNNHSTKPMYCFAETEDTVEGVRIAPMSMGYFEYSYAESAYQDCQQVS